MDEAANGVNLTVAIAIATGIVAQAVAQHLRIPGIVLLLLAGVVLGPDVLDVVHPDALGEGLTSLVGFAVAVILFEGGMNLSVPRIRRSNTPIQRLITVGALVTAVGATLAAWLIMEWSLTVSALFGTLVIVTGPTVVTPLLKRLRVERGVATILEAEGVLIDPIGAIIAVAALEIGLHPSVGSVAWGVPDVAFRLGVGGLVGGLGGLVVSRVLTRRGLVPEELTNVFTLSLVLVLYYVSDHLMPESGIAAVTVAGIAVRYLGTPVERELLEFKEQLTVLLIGMLFVLLAADVRIADVQALGWRGLGVAAVLALVVRPLGVAVSTLGTDLSWQQRAFLAWIAPRGIVAAAVASLFSVQLQRNGIAGGSELRAMVFLVIGLTVTSAGLTGGLVARALGLRRPSNQGWVVLGAHALGRKLARALLAGGEEVLLIDVNPENARAAEAEGIRVIHGNAMRETVLARAELDTRLGAIGITRNEEVNFLFVQKVRQVARLKRLYASLADVSSGVTPDMVHHEHAHILFGGPADVERWAARIDHGTARLLRCRYAGTQAVASASAEEARLDGKALPLVFKRNGISAPVGDHVTFRRRDEVMLVIDDNFEDQVRAGLEALGFVPSERTFSDDDGVDPVTAEIEAPEATP
ncbi:MAG: sodium:proton antiporter [Alphaproteobacteria bacterium]|nr:sodium:proton antiporter [Alphaproteobacteria bacterium]